MLQYIALFLASGRFGRAGGQAYWFCEVVRVGCLFAWNFSLTRSAVLLRVETRTR